MPARPDRSPGPRADRGEAVADRPRPHVDRDPERPHLAQMLHYCLLSLDTVLPWMHPDLQHGTGVRGNGIHRPSTESTPTRMTPIAGPDQIYITEFRVAVYWASSFALGLEMVPEPMKSPGYRVSERDM